MAFTYDPTTTLGQVRLIIADTDATDYTFSDAELNAFLSMQGGNVYLASAQAYGTIVRSRALLSSRIQREGYSSQENAIADLRQLIEDLKQEAVTAGGLQTGDFVITDEHFESYRPGWRSLNDPPVVE